MAYQSTAYSVVVRAFLRPFSLLTTLVVFGILLTGCSSDVSTAAPNSGTSPMPPPSAPTSLVEEATKLLVGEQDGSGSSDVVEGHQDGGIPVDIGLQDPGGSGGYAFDPSLMTFKVGETVNFSLTSETEFHTFTVSDLNIDVSIDFGETVEVSFTFADAGNFELICIPHFGNGMYGTLTVE